MWLYKIIFATITFLCSVGIFIMAYRSKNKGDKFSTIACIVGGILTLFSSFFMLTRYRNNYIFYFILIVISIVIVISIIFEIRRYNKKKSS
ncbi:hypothetical protein [Clostridium sp.]|uniref:hypothetical protein n=1 Tax=Clostridium sp. TaxID=1506 RepID=UPI003D6CF4B3